MSIRVAVDHRTTYRFDRSVGVGPHVVRLRPAPHTRTPIIGYTLVVTPSDHFLNWQQDAFGNFLARVVFPNPAPEISFQVEVVADLTPINPFDFFLEPEAETFPFVYEPELAADLVPYLETTDPGPLFSRFLARVDRSEQITMDFLVACNRLVQESVDYTIRLETGVQSCEETLQLGSGSCRDSAWLLVQLFRSLGLAARFVSGYLVQLVADEVPLEGPAGPTADFTDLHAWAEVYLPGAGWVGLDATSGLLAGEGHIPLAATPTPRGAAPITGAVDPCEAVLEFSNTVTRILETPRTTLPYRPDQRERILTLGRQVDRDLEAGDVRLTLGGEPTFVSVTDREGAEWNIDADGPTKGVLAEGLVMALRERFAPGSLLHVGQGKWYPGEPLPRWSKRLVWRTDGVPLWPDSSLIARPPTPETSAGDTAGDTAGGTTGDEDVAREFALGIARRLGFAENGVTDAYEDPVYHLWQESTLPEDVDPADLDPARADLDEVGHRRRLALLLDRGLGNPTGAILPLGHDGLGWRTGVWSFRRGRCFLLPGDSPLGLRLPLDRLRTDEEVIEGAPPSDPTDPALNEPLPAGEGPAGADESTAGAGESTAGADEVPAGAGEDPAGAGEDPAGADESTAGAGEDPAGERVKRVDTAVCTEVRDGVLYVFLPPLGRLEAFVELVGVVHSVASELGRAVRVEGYEPPADPRVRSLAVTPDPGVIEVNVHPTASWDESVEVTTELYRIARECGLTAERFDLDGRHTGTGGGNHVTLGGPTPADSPLLRRPDLLVSLITYWQHHPGLSYLFSGSFIGPTSQAPRVDEARHDTLDELEIAFAELRAQGEHPSPWIVDRLLRHLLVDVTGNTHRAEFCIDKLFAPDRAAGRLGLVELRAFEMPPHPDMSLVQQLLLRSLVAWFWKTPYRHPFVRWGSRLHDRYLLRHFVAEDVAEVCADLRRAGYPFDPTWLDPFVEFRFPLIGEVEVDGVRLVLHRSLEPWHVLGEEMTGTGTARAVDSSMERLQVEVVGGVPERHTVTCNGVPLVLHPVGSDGRMVGGVRYRAWNPPSCLHPTIGVDSPLVFDVVDTFSQRALGGCRYHVSHPGGRSYEVYPVNANEADGRRVSRFWAFGHTPTDPSVGDLTAPVEPWDRRTAFTPIGTPPGPVAQPVKPPVSPGFTLDLRRRG